MDKDSEIFPLYLHLALITLHFNYDISPRV